MNGKFLGKIQHASFGDGGYQDVQFGVSFTLKTSGGSVNTGKWEWNPEHIKVSEGTQWTECDRSHGFDNIMRYAARLMKEAKVKEFHKLVGTPIEAEFAGGSLKSWRILTEVL